MASEIDLFREGGCLHLRDETIRLQRFGKKRAKTLFMHVHTHMVNLFCYWRSINIVAIFVNISDEFA